MQTEIKEIIKKIAKETGISTEVVQKIVLSQWHLVAKTMKDSVIGDDDSFKNISLPHFGKFAVKPGRLVFLRERIKEKQLRDEGSHKDRD